MYAWAGVLPAETSTTAMKRAISSGSRPKDPSFSLNSNMASSKEPMPRALSDASEYVCPLRKVTVLSLGSNSEQNLTIRTCGQNQNRSASEKTHKDKKGSKEKAPTVPPTNLTGCTWKVPDLSSMTWSCWLRVWKPGMLFANSTTSLTAGVKHWEKDSHTSWLERLAGATGHELSGHACRRERQRERLGEVLWTFFNDNKSIDIHIFNKKEKKSHQHFGSSI